MSALISTSSAPSFLVIAFQATGKGMMDYKRYIALVNAHAEAFCGDQQRKSILLKIFMMLLQSSVPIGDTLGLGENFRTVPAFMRITPKTGLRGFLGGGFPIVMRAALWTHFGHSAGMAANLVF